ncbi:MAG TPA: type II secretion system F family protein [Bdellovibrionales bacterium]|nr:type II secretion system F family protein [Bdellovibrionales bacterium]
MSTFRYQAKMLNGRVVKGQIDAANETEARVKLRAQQMIPVSVVAKSEKSKSGGAGGFLQPSVKPKDLQIFTRQFSTLIASGIPVVQSLELLEKATKNVTLKSALLAIRNDISSGRRLAESMERHPKVFDRLFVNLVKAGEEGGVLDTILNRLATYIEKAVKLKNKVVGAMYYPVGVIAVSGLVVFAIMKFVIPQFEKLFKESGMELPLPTKIVIELSHFVQDYWWVILAAIIGAVTGIKAYYNTKEGRRALDLIMLKSPVLGSLLQKSAIARFSRTLSTLLACGVGIMDALEVSAKVSGNAIIEETLLKAKQVIAEGKSIVIPLSQDKFIPEMVTQMIGVGEQTGSMDTMLAKIADFYEEEVDTAVGAMTSLIEPLMMVFLGGMIGGIVIAMYLPIFDLASSVKG